MIQVILVGVVFSAAAFYLGRIVYRSFQAKEGCANGCGKCGATDIDKLIKNTDPN